jgi:hypothetical protein
MSQNQSRDQARRNAMVLLGKDPEVDEFFVLGPENYPKYSYLLSGKEKRERWVHSHRRRFELLEIVLSGNFSRPEEFLMRKTDMTNRLMVKRSVLIEPGPLYFEDAQGAAELFDLLEWITEQCDDVVQRHSPAEWLLLIRRAYQAPLDGISLAPRDFVEAYISMSRTNSSPFNLLGRSFRATPRLLTDVHDLIVTTTAIWNIRRLYRILCQGAIAVVGLRPTYRGILVCKSEDIRIAVELFDTRNRDNAGTFLARIGLRSPLHATDKEKETWGSVIPYWIEYGHDLDSNRYVLRWRTNYFPQFLAIDTVFFKDIDQPPASRSLAACALLWIVWKSRHWDRMRLRGPKGPEKHWGLAVISRDVLIAGLKSFEEIARQYDPRWNGSDALAEIHGRPAQTGAWSDAEPNLVFDTGEDRFLVDLRGAVTALSTAYSRPAGGSMANNWTILFERQVQHAIDESSWRPDRGTRMLIKKKITRRDGSTLTDIDALAACPRLGVLLLISVKAYATSSELEAGEYNKVHTRLDTIEKDVEDWRAKIELINADRPMLGVDTAQFPTIAGVVVCPNVPYVLPGPCTAEIVPGLRYVSTIAELERAFKANVC